MGAVEVDEVVEIKVVIAVEDLAVEVVKVVEVCVFKQEHPADTLDARYTEPDLGRGWFGGGSVYELQKGLALALLALRARRTLSALHTIPDTPFGARASSTVMVMVIIGDCGCHN